MKVISDILLNIQSVITLQKYDKNIEYRWIKYKIIKEVDNDIIIYNTFTREIILLSKDEYDTMDEKILFFLVEHWYLVPLDFHEKTFYNCFSCAYDKAYNIDNDYSGKYSHYTILTTTKCNARCPYCYEVNTKKRDMAKKTCYDVANFIKKNSLNKTIHISWFGGEPLLNIEAIDIISEELAKSNISWRSSIISNGFFFSSISEEKMRFWNLNKVQITLDGTEKEYEKIKKISFNKVLSNIEYLLKINIEVIIRLNLSKTNKKDLEKLVDLLYEEFGHYKNFTVYSMYIFEYAEDLQIYNDYIDLQNKIYKIGISLNKKNVPKVVRTHCMADNGHSIVINPNGELSLCEHYYDGDEVIGDIYHNSRSHNKEIINSWRVRPPERKECNDCCFYPQCYELKKCPLGSICNEGLIKYKDFEAEQIILNKYEEYKKYNERGGKNRKI